jgi:hypothetical protein
MTTGAEPGCGAAASRAADGSAHRPGYLGWNLMPPSKRMTSAFM